MIRAILFNVAFYVTTLLFLVLGSWLLFMPRRWAMLGFRAHAVTSVWLLHRIAGTRLEVRGRENLPPGPVLVAAKHQSAFDTFGLVSLMRDPAMIMKQELMWIPLYGWFAQKFGMIFVRRTAGPSALRRMARDAVERAGMGREIVIFPEGTRRPPGAPPDYKPGVILLYETLQIPCCPIALNSGLFWPRRSMLRYPGTIVVDFLDPIPAGLSREQFATRLQGAIESASDGLIVEAGAASDPPPTWREAMERVRCRQGAAA